MIRTILVVFIAVMLFSCESKESRLQSFLLKGNTALNEGNQDQALFYYNEALKIDPCFPDALNNSGTMSHNTGHYDEAIVLYSKAIECHPEFIEGMFNRANSFYESGEYYSALADIDHIIKKKPDTSIVYFMRGLVLTKQRDFPGAITSFQKALELGAVNESDCRVNLASVKIFMKQYDEAKTELEACIKLNPKEPNIYNSLALIAIEKKDFQEALRQVNQALEISPRQPFFLNNRGFINIQLNKLPEAETDINGSMTIDPYNAYAYRNKGILLVAKNDFSNAERLLKKAFEMDKNTEKILYYLGLVYEKNSNPHMACDYYRQSNEAGEGMVTSKQQAACKGVPMDDL